MYGYIYLITDKTTGKKYVGQHKYDKYFELDKMYKGSGKIIMKINKKRPESLSIEYLMPVETKEESDFFENYWIYKLNTLFPNGLNLSEGGEANPMDFEFVREKHRKIMQSEEYRRKLSASIPDMSGERNGMFGKGYLIEGERNGFYGKHHTEESKQKLREAFSGEKNPQYGKKGELSTCYGRTGDKHPMYGKHHTKEAKHKIHESFIRKRIENPKFVCPAVLYHMKNIKRLRGTKLENELLKLGIETDYKYLQNESRIYNIKYKL